MTILKTCVAVATASLLIPVLVGCGDDDSASPKADGGGDVVVTPTDDAATDSPVAVDPTFPKYVRTLIETKTTPTELPASMADIDKPKDSAEPADFAGFTF